MPEPESPPIGPLLKATTNYLTSIGRQPSADEGRALEAHLLTLKAEQIDSLTGRLALYQLLDGQTGRDLREAANNSSTLLAAQLRQEQSHVRSVL